MGGRHRLCIQSQNVLADLWVLSCCCFLFFSLSPSIFLGLCLWNMYPWIHNLAPQSWGNSCLPQLEQKKKKEKTLCPRHTKPNVNFTALVQCEREGGQQPHLHTYNQSIAYCIRFISLWKKKAFMFKYTLNEDWFNLLCVFCLDFWSYNTWGHPNKVFGLKIEECFF